MHNRKSERGKRIVSGILAGLMVLSAFLGTGAIAANAEEPDDAGDDATISLLQSEHGTLSFADSEDSSIRAKVGSVVTVNADADDGYAVNSITAVDVSDNVTNLYVQGGSATMKVERDATITVSYKETMEREVARMDVAVDESKAAPSETVEDYILKHADRTKTGKGDVATIADAMTVTHSFVDGTKLKNATFDALWSKDEDNDGYSDNEAAFLSQSNDGIVLYEIGDGDYFVGKVGNAIAGAAVTDWQAGKDDMSGTIYDDIEYDDASRLVYVPKTYRTSGDQLVIGSTKLQLLYTVTGQAEAMSDVAVSVDSENVDGNVTENGVGTGSILNTVTELVIAKDETAKDDVDSNTIDAVIVNGNSYDKESGMWTYDIESGKLVIQMSPATVDTVEVQMSNGFVKDLKNFVSGLFNMKADAASNNVQGKWVFDREPKVGDTWTVTNAFSLYDCVPNGNGAKPLVPTGALSGDAGIKQFVLSVLDASGYDKNDLTSGSTVNVTWETLIYGGVYTLSDGSQIKVDQMQMELGCAHLGVTNDFVYGDNNGTISDANGKDIPKTRARISVLAIDGDTIYFGVITPTVNNQCGYGAFRVHWEVGGGNVQLHKYSANPEYTKDNPMYDLTGAKYGIYTDEACTNLVATLTVENNLGLTNVSDTMSEGTYWVKEMEGTAKGYLVNPNKMSFHLAAGKTTVVDMNTPEMLEPALDDPFLILLQKRVAGVTDPHALGDMADLSGIKFRVDYYNNVYASREDAVKSGAPTASAIFETNAKGALTFFSARPIDGTTWPYMTNTSTPTNTIPLGTVVVTEVETLGGLIVSGHPKTFTLTDPGSMSDKAVLTPIEGWDNMGDGHDTPLFTIDNEPIFGGVTVYKADADGHEQNPQGDGSLEGITYEIINKSKSGVSIHGNTYPVNEVIATITTVAKDGGYVASYDGLPYGTYQIRESAGNDSYHSSDWSKTFSIRTNGEVVSYDRSDLWNEDPVKRGGVEITKVDATTGESLPQGDASLVGATYEVYNRSNQKVYVNGAWVKKGEVVGTITSQWNEAKRAHVATMTGLPYGTYEVVETAASEGYLKPDYSQTFTIRSEGQVVELKNANNRNNEPIMLGGLAITKADMDLGVSTPQGDAKLDGVEYSVINRSKNAVVVDGVKHQPGDKVLTMTTSYDADAQAYTASVDANTLPYGTYEIEESSASTGYNNAKWSQTFSIRANGEMHLFDSSSDTVTKVENTTHYQWNVNPPMRGGLIVGKVDRETNQYLSLGEAKLDGAVFAVINRSANPVFVNGTVYGVGETIMKIASKEMEYDGKQIYAATTGNNVLPYGTYEVKEISSGTGYLYDSMSKAYTDTIQIRADGQMVEAKDVANQVLREDWHFKKKQEDSMERMDKIAFEVESLTTGERHVIVTDENGTWGSAWVDHAANTNANDPTSPITNGAMGIADDGSWYVKDSSKLDFDCGTWFTGLSEDEVTWSADGTSYDVNGTTVAVNDDLRAFPYDTYRVTELRCENNDGYQLVSFTVTLHRYTKDHDGEGLDIDYGTIDDKRVAIGTTLTSKDGTKVVPTRADTVLVDTVTYDGLDANKTYIMKGEIHLVNDDGTDGGIVSTNETTFDSGRGSGRMTMDFKVDTSKLGGKSLVAFEYLMEKKTVIATHADLEDEGQTVRIPEIKTTLTGDAGHVANAEKLEIVLTDKITYKGLEAGKEFVATGTLMNQADGTEVVDRDGNPITATTSFVPTSANGSVDVTFTFHNVDIAGKTVVAFESVTQNGIEYAVHADIDDEAQTVYFPKVGTKVATVDGLHELQVPTGVESTVVITDTVSYENVIVGKTYTVNGTLHVRALAEDGSIIDAGTVKDADGNDVVGTATFEATDTNGTAEVEFVFDASGLQGKTVVAFEDLLLDGVVVGTHADITDENQSIHFVEIGTTALAENGLHEMQVPDDDGIVTITDRVSYKNLIVGNEYKMSGTLHAKYVNEDGQITDVETVGEAECTFTPESADGFVDVMFELDASEYAGQTVVAFEELSKDDVVFATHMNIEDEDQSVHFVEIGTTALAENGTHMTQISDEGIVTLTDTVSYTNLIPGVTYTMKGTPHIQSLDEDGKVVDGGTIKVVTDDGDSVDLIEETTFTPETANGTVDVIFTFDASELDGKTITMFETLTRDDVVVATHEDITDEAQSVHFVKMRTKALAENGEHEIQIPKGNTKITITDLVEYKNLIPGLEYTMTGEFHMQSKDAAGNVVDGGVLKDEAGNVITANTVFTPKTSDGSVDVKFELDIAKLGDKTIVAFETLTQDDVVIAVHADITDKHQSITILTPPEEPEVVHTGQAPLYVAMALLGLALATGAGYVWIRKRRI